MESNFTIWVRNARGAQMRIVVRDVTDVNTAIQQVLKKAAQEWGCHPATLTIYGIAEGDITSVDPGSSSH
jgi:anti-anti-sigma regulatory factor